MVLTYGSASRSETSKLVEAMAYRRSMIARDAARTLFAEIHVDEERSAKGSCNRRIALEGIFVNTSS